MSEISQNDAFNANSSALDAFALNSFASQGTIINVQINESVFRDTLNTALSQEQQPALDVDVALDKDTDMFTDTHGNLNSIHFDIGIDEVGRGPLYGNVVIGAVILPSHWSYAVNEVDHDHDRIATTPLAGLTDSKKISENKRNLLKPNIEAHAIGVATVDVPAHVIDKLNIYQATLLGMKVASEVLIVAILNSLATTDLSKMTKISPTFKVLIDGNAQPKFEWQSLNRLYPSLDGISDRILFDCQRCEAITAETWVKGDARHTVIAAASVIAKVRRDAQLIQAGERYPEYGLQKHKGYPTKAHIQALAQYGALPEHRRSFKPVQKVLAAQDKI